VTWNTGKKSHVTQTDEDQNQNKKRSRLLLTQSRVAVAEYNNNNKQQQHRMTLLSPICISHFSSISPSSSFSVSPTTFLQCSWLSTDSGNTRATNLCSKFNSLHCGKTLLRHRHNSPYFSMPSSSSTPPSFTSGDETGKRSKRVWIWTTNKQVVTAAVERGWNTFVFPSHHRQLAQEWSCKFFIRKQILSPICVFFCQNLIWIDCKCKNIYNLNQLGINHYE